MGAQARAGVLPRSWAAVNDQLVGHYRAVVDGVREPALAG
jgi:hypothetical protein